jgi:signal peptidase I
MSDIEGGAASQQPTTPALDASTPPPRQGRARHRREAASKSTSRSAVEWIVVVVVALVLAFLVRTFLFQTFFIPSGSMEPTLQIGDRIIVSKLSYNVHNVNRGDIIVFNAPPAEATACADPEIKDLVKRVIGLPGETISSVGNTILINNRPLSQPWFPATPLGPPIQKQVIPANSYFMMGDNRTNSCDSRSWGTLPGGDIIGHVVLTIWPLSRIGIP